MNARYLFDRIRGRATCVCGEGVSVRREARIVNLTGDSRRIHIGAHSIVRGELLTFSPEGSIELGEWCYVAEGARIWAAGTLRVGHRTLIAHNVTVVDSRTHSLDPAARHAHFRAIATLGHPANLDLGTKPVTIGDDVWIAAAVVILRGVTIGARTVVAAGSVLTRSVPSDCLVAGNPARIVRSLDRESGQRDASSSAPGRDQS